MSIGDLVLKRRGLLPFADQREVARRMGWYKETLVDVERGKIGLTEEDARRLEAALNEIESVVEQQMERKEQMVVL